MRITPYFTKWKGKFKLGHRLYGFKAWIEHGSISVRVASEEGGADWCAVEAEFGGDDLGGFETGLESASFYFLNNRIKYQRAGVHHTATEHDALDIQKIDHARDAGADVFSSALDHHEREIVAFIGLVCDVFRCECFVQSE